MPRENKAIKQRNTKPSTFDTKRKGAYCYFGCGHFREEYMVERDSDGNEYNVDTSYCALGNLNVYGFCEDFEE